MRTTIAITLAALVAVAVLTTCRRDDGKAKPAPAMAPIPQPAQPVRVAAEDEDLRVLLAELAASKACTMIRGQYRPLRAADRPGVVTGTLWIRGCKITQHGRQVSFHLTGKGWQWADQEQKKVGATFALRQYVRFDADATIPGALDVAYARKAHIVSLWFSPSALPDVTFTPTGDLDVDREGAWSSVVGAIGTLFAHSPESLAEDAAKKQGTHEFEKQFADGLSVTVDLCTGLPRFGLGRPPQGKMVAPDAGETRQVPIELEAGGVMAFGPYLDPHGLTVKAHVRTGGVKLEAACQDDAAALTLAYATTGDATAPLKRLGGKDLRADGSFRIKKASCPVVVIARPLGAAAATFDWQRPVTEAANAAGGPLIDCD